MQNDMYCAPERQLALLRIILTIYRKGRDLIQAGVPLAQLRETACVPQVLRAKAAFGNTENEKVAELHHCVIEELEALGKQFAKPTA